MSYATISTVRELAKVLRAGRYTSLGSYPVFFVTGRGDVLSYNTVRENVATIRRAILRGDDPDWRVAYWAVNYEGPHLYCDHSGERIESAYAEPEGT